VLDRRTFSERLRDAYPRIEPDRQAEAATGVPRTVRRGSWEEFEQVIREIARDEFFEREADRKEWGQR
jgi:hypothetical protein